MDCYAFASVLITGRRIIPKILVIDDDRLVRETTRIVLAGKGYTVTVAENGTSGIEAAQSDTFDAVIVDLFMPDIDGLKVIETLHRAYPDLPLIAASGFMFGGGAVPEMPNFEAMTMEAGATATLYKPFRPETLLQTVSSAIGVPV